MKVLLSSAGRRVSLLRIFQAAVARRGPRGGVYAADASPSAPCAFLADRFFEVPRCSERDYIPTLLDVCRRESIGLVVPTIDTELPVLAANRKAFDRIGTTVAVSALRTVDLCADKARTHDWLEENAFPVPWQLEIREGGEIPDESDLSVPLIAKPRYGSSAVGVRRIEQSSAISGFVALEDTVLEEHLCGDEFTANVYLDRAGRVRCAIPHRRIAVRGGEVTRAVTAKREDIVNLVSAIAEKLSGAYGPINVQVFACIDGGLRVTEINPRFSGGYPLAERAGARFADWLIQEAGGEMLRGRHLSWQDGVSMSRFDTEVFIDPKGHVVPAVAERAEGYRA